MNRFQKLLKKNYVDRRLLFFLVSFYTIFTLISFIKRALLFNKQELGDIVHNPWQNVIFYFVDWIVVVGYMSMVAMLMGTQYFHKRRNKVWQIAIHLILSILLGVLIMASLHILVDIFGKSRTVESTYESFFDGVILYADLNFLVYFSMLGIIFFYYHFKAIEERKKKESELQSKLSDFKMRLFRSQIEPHFIFNTLNSISSLMESSIEDAQEMISNLGFFIRKVLDKGDNPWISLEQELEILRKYTDILRVRFHNDLKINYDIENGLYAVNVPFFILQPIVENSIKHGYSYFKKKISIEIRISRNNGFLNILIANNGASLKKDFSIEKSLGKGLKGLHDRLAIYYGEDFHLMLKNQEGQRGVVNLMTLPILVEEHELLTKNQAN